MSDLKNRIEGAVWGALVGDALGVPVEFQSRESCKQKPVTDMRGFGTHQQPAGTFSDDGSLLLITLEALLSGFNTRGIADGFVKWQRNGYWAAHGEVFDIGIATSEALNRIKSASNVELCGGNSEDSNGNGSLMRILPIALLYHDLPVDQLLDRAHRVSSLTHRHPRSLIGCGIYSLLIAEVLKGKYKNEALAEVSENAQSFYRNRKEFSSEITHYERIFYPQFMSLKEEEIHSSGYVVHTLEASIWCWLNCENYQESVLRAVNLGSDTDTTGCVTGGLAGAYDGLRGIPKEWISKMARFVDIKLLISKVEAASAL